MFSCHQQTQWPSLLPSRPPGKSSSTLEKDAAGLVGGSHQCRSNLLAGWKSDSVTLHLLDHFPVSQKEHTRSINWTSPDFFLQLPFWSCWGSAGSFGHRLAQIRATLVSGKVSRLLLFQSLDCGLCYTSPTLHLPVTRSPDTPTWFSRSSVYSLPSASQRFQLNQIL